MVVSSNLVGYVVSLARFVREGQKSAKESLAFAIYGGVTIPSGPIIQTWSPTEYRNFTPRL
jgi:hypothetical protein